MTSKTIQQKGSDDCVDRLQTENAKLAEYVYRLEVERAQLLNRVKELLPWVGVCPLEPAKIREMYILKDLAEDSLKEIREDMQRDKQRSR